MENKNTYWNGEGKHKDVAERLQSLMPDIGYTDNDNMNLLIYACKLYYDVYNNGGCNLADCYMGYASKYLAPFASSIKSLNVLVSSKTVIKNLCNLDKLERFMDEIFLLLSDKDMSYTQFKLYVYHTQEKVSKSFKEDFKELIFGEHVEYEDWLENRLNVFKYALV